MIFIYYLSLLAEDCAVLNCLGRSVTFEVAAGVNGRMWEKSDGDVVTIIMVK